MTMLAWSDDYSVAIQEIDEQHKQLVALINNLYTAMAGKRDREQIGRIINELVDYTRIHFAVEECLMRMFHYQGYDAHKDMHDGIVKRVKGFQERYHGGDDMVGMELLLFLKDWLLTHIQKVDRLYSDHLLKHGVKKSWLRRFW